LFHLLILLVLQAFYFLATWAWGKYTHCAWTRERDMVFDFS
jgi:hypothetical protein